jgi:hypothetical protein
MKTFSKFLLLAFACFGASSCVMTNQIRTIQIEILRPAIFNVPKDNTIAVINRDIFKSDTCTFRYSNGYIKNQIMDGDSVNRLDTVKGLSFNYLDLYETHTDTSINYHNLADTCISSLVNFLESEKYFKSIIIASDSLRNLLKTPGSVETKEELFEKTGSDVCVFLDYLHFKTTFNQYFLDPFTAKAMLIWTVAFKNDSSIYSYNLADTLFYDQPQLQVYSKFKDKILNKLVNNSCIYLGQSFGKKMIPNWTQTERLYYKSNNPEMKNAQKLALEQDWIRAAEIWNRLSKNKNDKIVAKACYNMALACEMEGKPDLAIAWLVKSFSGLKKNDEQHKAICQRYVNILAIRKLEIERLEEQVNIQDLSNKTEN